MQESSGAKIVVSRSNEFYPDTTGNQDRVILISGSSPCVLTALRLMLAILEEDEHTDASCIRVLIHDKLCGGLIGKMGSTIKSLAQESGAVFSVSARPTIQVLHERVINISGNGAQILRGVEVLLAKLASMPSYENFTDDIVNYSSKLSTLLHTGAHHERKGPVDKDGSTIEIPVPEAKAGAIIGKQGHVITQIQELLGVRMTMSRKGEIIQGTTNRTCTVSGSKEAVEIAERIVNMKINSA